MPTLHKAEEMVRRTHVDLIEWGQDQKRILEDEKEMKRLYRIRMKRIKRRKDRQRRRFLFYTNRHLFALHLVDRVREERNVREEEEDQDLDFYMNQERTNDAVVEEEEEGVRIVEINDEGIEIVNID